MFQCLTPIDRPCVGTRCIVWPYTQAAVCLTVRLSVSVGVCHSLHRMALLKCVASLYRLALLRQPSVSRFGVSVSASVCGIVVSSGLTQAAVCLTVHLSVSVSVSVCGIVASSGLTQAAVCLTVRLSVSVSVSVCGSYCIVWPYSSQRLSHAPCQCQCVSVSGTHCIVWLYSSQRL